MGSVALSKGPSSDAAVRTSRIERLYVCVELSMKRSLDQPTRQAGGRPARAQVIASRDRNGRFESRGRFEERRDALVRTAAQLFAANGYHATSMAELSDAAGLKRGGIYHYIDSKADLLRLIHESVIAPLDEELHEIERRDIPAPEAVRALFHAFINSIAGRNDEVRVFLHEWKAVTHLPQWEEVSAQRRELERVVERVLARGNEEGTLYVPDPRLSALGLLGMANYLYTWFDPAGARTPEQIADRFSADFLHGVEVRD